MRILLDPSLRTPLYRQLEAWFRDAIISGALPPRSRLPSTRALAADLGVSRVTVGTAYAELESSGLVVAAVGSGTRVAPTLPTVVRHRREAAPAEKPPADVIAFTGVGDPAAYPVAEFGHTIRQVLKREGAAALSYQQDPAGDPSLRRTVTQLLASQGIGVSPDSVLITSGSQQALALVCDVLIRPGDRVVVEEPTYDLALRLFRARGADLVGVPIDEHGMRVDADALTGAKLLYVTPNFQNPTGATLSGPRRRELLRLARAHNVPVFEDDFAGDLRYSGRAIPAIKSLDRTGQVLYAGTFSKLLMPGLRIGYVVVDGPLRERLIEAKQVTDLGTSLLLQRALDRFVTVGRYQANLRRTIRLYRERRDAMRDALTEHFPDAKFTVPAGGLFLWVECPEIRGSAVAEGTRFFLDPERGRNYVRLNFAVQPPDRIVAGIRGLIPT